MEKSIKFNHNHNKYNLVILCVGNNSNIFVSKNSLALSTSTLDYRCDNGMNRLTFNGILVDEL